MATLLGTDTLIQGSSLSTWTKSLTIPANTNLVYIASGLRNNSFSSMSLAGGGTGAEAISLNAGAAGQPSARIWRIQNTITGSDTLTVNLSGATAGALAIYYVQGNTTTPEVSTNSVDANADTTPTLTMTTVSGSLVIDAIANYDTVSRTGTPDGTQTEVLDNYANQLHAASSHISATSTTQNIGWTLTGTANIAYVAVALTPFGGGGGGPSSTPAFGRYGVRGPVR